MHYNVTVSAAPRGCGNLKKGGVYVGSEVSPFGTLRSWVPLLMAPDFVPEPRVTKTITVDEFNSHLVAVNKCPEIPIPHTHVMVSHVGLDYTPATFADETAARGVSRRIAPSEIPADISPPIPIIFTHGHAVVSDSEGDTELGSLYIKTMDWLANFRPEDFDRTWTRENFGWSLLNDWRPVHPMQLVYRFLDQLKEKREYAEYMLSNALRRDAGVIGGSFVTYIFWVPPDDETPMPDELAAKGVARAILEGGEAE